MGEKRTRKSGALTGYRVDPYRTLEHGSLPCLPAPTKIVSMIAQRCLDGTNSSGEWPETKQALQVTIAYKDLAAGKRAMHTLAQLGRGLVDDIEFQPFPWSFDLLMDANWRDIAFRHAVQADILILATSDSVPVPTGVTQWMETILDRKQGTDWAVVALFG